MPKEKETSEEKPQQTEVEKEKVEEFLDEKKEETKPDTKPEPKEEPIAEAKLPEIDTEALKEEVRKEVSAEVTSKLVQSLTGKKETDIKEQSPWAKEGRNPRDYDEIADWGASVAEKKLETKQKEETKKAEEIKATQEEGIKKSNEAWNKYWDNQLDDLTTQGKLPKIEKPEEETDRGVVARRDLFTQMSKANEERNIKGQPLITSIKEFYYEGYNKPGTQPAGADAPVSGGKTTVGGDSGDDFSYEEIHGARSLQDLIKPKA